MRLSSETEEYDDLDYERYWQRYGGADDNPPIDVLASKRGRREQAISYEE